MEAVRRAGSNQTDAVVEAFRRSNVPTFFGLYSYSSDNTLLMGGYVYQAVNSSRIPISPISVRVRALHLGR